MARLSVQSDRVKSVVDNKLVPLFLAEGSTAGLCKALNRHLPENQNAIIHPNRLHALLSDDVSRGVNDKTLDLVEGAADAFVGSDGGWETRAEQELKRLQGEAQFLRRTSGLDTAAIQRRLSIPPAVVRHVLAEKDASVTSTSVSAPVAENKARRAPNWSFQEIAISRTLEAFRQRPTSKVGLILPTGAGKTRTALRIVLKKLDQARDSESQVYWVTHRKNLRTQAHRELQKLLSAGAGQIPEDAATLLAKRIRFVMVSELPKILAPDAVPPLLIVVDEAHHAAAPSYQPIFEVGYPVPALFLTATPNRTDNLPIGIDEIAFTITYRELEERGVVFMPAFRDFPVDDFEWTPEQVKDLADFVIDEAAGPFTKTLVLAPRIDRVEEFYNALLTAHAAETGHPLDVDDIGFIHGTGNSLYNDNEDFLDIFSKKPRAIIVSAQLLLEGFDDPQINTVIVTYPSSSVVRLMQAAGRCVRYAEGKTAAYVVQARNDDLAYHFDQRWLYQEISDYLRPELIDIEYGSEAELRQNVAMVLDDHRVKPADKTRILNSLKDIQAGDLCRLLLYGFPYYEEVEKFEQQAPWGALLETKDNSDAFRGIFNAFCAQGASLSDPSDFLTREAARQGVTKDLSSGSLWRTLMEVLTSSYFAYEEIYGSNPAASASRPSKRIGPTTWLRYITFLFHPELPSELSEFLADCYNKDAITAAYLDAPERSRVAIKIPLPLGGNEGWLLSPDGAEDFDACVRALRNSLAQISVADQIGALAAFLADADYRCLPSRILLRVEAFLVTEAYDARVLRLTPPHASNPSIKETGNV